MKLTPLHAALNQDGHVVDSGLSALKPSKAQPATSLHAFASAAVVGKAPINTPMPHADVAASAKADQLYGVGSVRYVCCVRTASCFSRK